MKQSFIILVFIVCVSCNYSTENKIATKSIASSKSELPYPQSEQITSFTMDTARISMGHGDNWAITWAENNKQYSFFTDGTGFGGFSAKDENHIEVSSGMVELDGNPEQLDTRDILAETGTIMGLGGNETKKVSGLVMIDTVLYAWIRNLNLEGTPKGTGSTLMYSDDYGENWEWADWNFPEIGYPTWLNAGKNYADAKDNYAYFISPDGPSAYADYPNILMGRVHKDSILFKESYVFYSGLKNEAAPQWRKFSQRQPILTDAGGIFRPDIVYNPGIDRYMLSVSSPFGDWSWWANKNTNRKSHFAIYDSPNPWGPWTTVYYKENWGQPENRFAPHIPPKWISEDGKSFYLLYSCIPTGPYQFNVQRCELTLK